MFQPVSDLTYRRVHPEGQIVVVCCPIRTRIEEVVGRWPKAAAVVHDATVIVRDVVRDILANPQIRVLAFDGETCSRRVWDAFFDGRLPLEGIEDEHLTLVCQFVTVYDDVFYARDVMQPFWPARIRYVK